MEDEALEASERSITSFVSVLRAMDSVWTHVSHPYSPNESVKGTSAGRSCEMARLESHLALHLTKLLTYAARASEVITSSVTEIAEVERNSREESSRLLGKSPHC